MHPVSRIVAVWCLVLLTIFQVVSVPLASAMGGTVEHAGCEHGATVHEWHADADCGDRAQSKSPDGPTRHPAGSGDRCHCVHVGIQVQSVSSPLSIVSLPSQAGRFAREPRAAAHSDPLFELLRPPN